MAARLVVTANQMMRLNRGGACDGSGESLYGGWRKVILGEGRKKKKSKMVLSCAGPGQQDTSTHRHLIFSEPQNMGTGKAIQMKITSIYILECLFFSSSLVYFWEMSGSAASLLLCVGHVKCFLSNLALLLQLQKGDEHLSAISWCSEVEARPHLTDDAVHSVLL